MVAGLVTGLVDKQNGNLDEAIAKFKSVVEASSPELRERGFDFSKDYSLLNELGLALHERAKQERGEARRRGATSSCASRRRGSSARSRSTPRT